MKLKKPKISPIISITFGLILLTVSIILIGDLLGFIPNQNKIQVDSRKTISESLAIQVSSSIGIGKMDNALELLTLIVKFNDDILSIKLKNINKKSILETDKHAEYWLKEDDNKSTITNIEVPILNKEGRWGTLEVAFKPLNNLFDNFLEGNSLLSFIIFLIISGSLSYWLFLKRALSELDPSSVVPDRVRSALDTLIEGLVILDAYERIIFVNESLKKKVGLTEKQLLSKKLSDLKWMKEDEKLMLNNNMMPWNQLFETGETPKPEYLKLKTQYDEIFSFEVNVSPIKEPNQQIKGVVVTIDDITELEKKNKELQYILAKLESTQEEIVRKNKVLLNLATRDPLTNLFNRRALFENLDTLLLEARNTADIISCIILDIDHFKSVNDTYGHAVGDDVIRIFSLILQDSVGINDIVGRYGGEEFVIVIPSKNEEEAAKVAEKIRIRISEKVHDGLPSELWIASSFGVSSTSSGEWKSDNLIDLADKALYVAKKSGRNCVVCYSKINLDHSEIEIVTPSISRTSKSTKSTIDLSLSNKKEYVETELLNKSGEIALEVFDKIAILSRTVILDRLNQAIKMASRDKTNLTILTVNIDNLQSISNVIGHEGAEKLRKIAYNCLVKTFRSSDSVIPDMQGDKGLGLSRTSDSEFIAILTGIEKPSITAWIVERMLKDLGEVVLIDGKEIIMRAYVGGSIYPMDGTHPDELLKNSNIALQNTLKGEMKSFLFYNNEMNELSKYELEVESQLRLALKREEFYLKYQPITNLKTRKTSKFEVLIRWEHPTLGLVSPDSFIHIAENSGMINSIGLWVFKKACYQLKKWHDDGYTDLKMSINVSVVQFNQRNFANDFIEILEEVGVMASSIVLEMTETVLVKEYGHISKLLQTLNDKGFEIALDDFGTGFSSLEHLQEFPINCIKIDRSLISNFPKNMNSISIISALINLAHNLNLYVIVEGLENEIQLSTLLDLKADEIQGYLLSRPLSVIEATQYLNSTESRKLLNRVGSVKGIVQNDINSTINLSDIINPLSCELKKI